MSQYAVFLTAIGWAGIQYSGRGIQRVILPRKSSREVRELLDGAQENPDACSDLQKRLKDYFSGKREAFPDELDFSGASAFQRRVWQAARSIPYGRTQSYRWIAAQINQPGAARATGQALGRNPFPIIVPCHCVLASDGTAGGFSGGISMKVRLLELEGAEYRRQE